MELDTPAIERGAGEAGDPFGQPGGATEPGVQANVGMDGSFVHFAAMTNEAEIELGRLAQKQAQSPEVREYASRLVADHTKALQELQQIAQVPEDPQLDAQHQATYDRLSKLSGEEFDREFMKEMVAGHQKAVDRFQAEARDTAGTMPGTAGRPAGTTGQGDAASEREIDQYAEKTLPTLRHHLESAQQIQRDLQ